MGHAVAHRTKERARERASSTRSDDEQVGVGNPMNAHRGNPGAAGQMHLRVFTGRALAELAELHGLKVEVARTAGFYPLPPRLATIADRVAPRYGAFLVQRYTTP